MKKIFFHNEAIIKRGHPIINFFIVTKGKANALLAASVFHFNEISIKEVKQYLLKKNIEIRL